MSLIDVIYSLATGASEPTPGQYTVTRQTANQRDAKGRPTVAGTSSTFPITACVQPVTGRDLQLFADTGITKESQSLWTDTPINTRIPGFEPDQVTIAGEQWSVIWAKRWEAFGDVLYKAFISRQSMQ